MKAIWSFGVALVVAGCGPGTAESPTITAFVVDPTDLAVGGQADVHVEVAHFSLTEHSEASTAHEEGGEHAEGEVQSGHVHVYLDDLETNPLLMMSGADGTITIPSGTAIGSHVLIARLHGDDHLIVEPEVTSDVAIEVVP